MLRLEKERRSEVGRSLNRATDEQMAEARIEFDRLLEKGRAQSKSPILAHKLTNDKKKGTK